MANLDQLTAAGLIPSGRYEPSIAVVQHLELMSYAKLSQTDSLSSKNWGQFTESGRSEGTTAKTVSLVIEFCMRTGSVQAGYTSSD